MTGGVPTLRNLDTFELEQRSGSGIHTLCTEETVYVYGTHVKI